MVCINLSPFNLRYSKFCKALKCECSFIKSHTPTRLAVGLVSCPRTLLHMKVQRLEPRTLQATPQLPNYTVLPELCVVFVVLLVCLSASVNGSNKINTKEKSSFKLTYEIWEPDNSEKIDR